MLYLHTFHFDTCRYCGRVTPRHKRQSLQQQKSQSRPGSSSSRKDSTRHSTSETTPPTTPMSPPSTPSWRHRQMDPELQSAKQIEQTSLPKQSGFVPKSRPRTVSESTDNEDYSVPEVGVSSSRKSQRHDGEDDSQCRQSSFHQRQRQKEQDDFKQKYGNILNKKTERVAQLTQENLSLKDSIDKVRNWKKQLTDVDDDNWRPPTKWGRPGQQSNDSVFSDEDDDDAIGEGEPVVYGKGEYRGRKDQKSSNRRSGPLSPKSAKSPSDSDISEAGFLKDASPNRDIPMSKDKKMYAGVKGFPKDVQVKQTGSSKLTVGRDDRAHSPYDNLRDRRRAHSPYDNKPPRLTLDTNSANKAGSRMRPGPSIDSLASGFGDESDLPQSDEEGGMSRATSVSSLDTHMGSLPRKAHKLRAPSMESLGTSRSSLPDVVTSSEQARRGGGYIGKVQDIDSFLDFTETEDDFTELSDDESDYQDSRHGSLQRQHGRDRDAHLGPITEENGVQNGYGHAMVDNVYIADWTDVDDLMDSDELEQYKYFSSRSPDRLKKQPSLEIPQTKIDYGSSESLLDTPVPDTPDEPLAPVQAFPFPKPRSKNAQSASMDQLNDVESVSNKLRKQTSKGKRKPAKKTQSVGNLDDLDNLLDTIAKTPTPKKKDRTRRRDDRSAFDLLTRDAKDDLRSTASIDADHPEPNKDNPLVSIDVVDDAGAGGTPTGTLVDLDFQPQPPTPVKKFYPPGYSKAAVKEILKMRYENGEVSIVDLCQVCSILRTPKPPWVEEDEDRNFTGYRNVTEMLEDMGIDCKQVSTKLLGNRHIYQVSTVIYSVSKVT